MKDDGGARWMKRFVSAYRKRADTRMIPAEVLEHGWMLWRKGWKPEGAAENAVEVPWGDLGNAKLYK